jgi:hypothetical protein
LMKSGKGAVGMRPAGDGWPIFLFIPVVLAILASFATPAGAIEVERLVMPGDVISGHAKYESQCSKCHRPFSRTTQRSLCLDCHEKVADDVKRKKGYHGLESEARETECRRCHTEHKGRDAKVVGLDPEVFDHSLTDLPLKGRHARVRCAECHKPKKKYREAPKKCIDCHKEDDRHKGELGKDCAKCHKESVWTKSKFDHDKTDFKLKGKHADVMCNRCHPNDRYKKTPTKCYDCHLLSDVHGGEYGKKCADCHTARDWKKYKYDHDKTDFPLKGRHIKTDCIKCHKGPMYGDKKLPDTCYGCHKNDDEHKGRYGKKCKDCHTPKEWKKTVFNHDKTDYPLKNKHRKVVCEKCHRGPVGGDKKLPDTCNGCHKADDPHGGRQSERCERCHSTRGWSTKVSFDHDLTKFPLIGLHALSSCEDCHVGAAYKSTSSGCNACHSADDVHKRALGPNCELCHNPNSWGIWQYDHDKETEFKLDGGHKGLQCGSCHKRPARKKVKLSKTCSGCHRDDDIHRGGFGLSCSRCHTTKSFDEIRLTK